MRKQVDSGSTEYYMYTYNIGGTVRVEVELHFFVGIKYVLEMLVVFSCSLPHDRQERQERLTRTQK